MSVTTDPLQRTRFLPAHVEILLAASEIGDARAAAEELARSPIGSAWTC